MRFKIDEKIAFLSEIGEGVVLRYAGNNVYIVKDLDTGFERKIQEKYLVKIEGTIDFQENDSLEFIEKVNFYKKNRAKDLHVKKENKYWEIDIHTHAFMEDERNLTNGELLNRQLNEFKQFYHSANEALVRKLIVIHGVGKGTLKNEIRDFLKGKGNIEYYDADFREYGKGATEIRIFYNK